jgi:hypothetical protein
MTDENVVRSAIVDIKLQIEMNLEELLTELIDYQHSCILKDGKINELAIYLRNAMADVSIQHAEPIATHKTVIDLIKMKCVYIVFSDFEEGR